MNLFGKKVDPVEQAKEWKRSLVREQRSIERDIAHIKREEQKAAVLNYFRNYFQLSCDQWIDGM